MTTMRLHLRPSLVKFPLVGFHWIMHHNGRQEFFGAFAIILN